MGTKKNDLHAVPTEMQAKLNQEREQQVQRRTKQLQKDLEIVGKKMEDEFVTKKPDKELVGINPSENNGLFDPSQKSDDGEIVVPDV